jgi:hypothetical protein
MQFRRSGQRDERRRRVLLEDAQAASSEGGAGNEPSRLSRRSSGATAAPGKRYSDAARPERQPRVTDLAPVRAWTLSVLLMSLLSLVAALIGLDGQVGDWSRLVGRANLAPLDLAAAGSLASWFRSVLLATAAVYSVLVFLIRRHKVDDYRGRYRYWMAATLLLLLGSVDASTGLHRTFGALIARSSGLLTAGDGAAWSLILAGVLFGGLALRGLIEIRHSRGAVASLLIAATAYGASAACFTGLIPLYDSLSRLLGHTCLLLAHVMTLFCVMVFARYVLLDSQGRLRERAPQPKRKREPAASEGATSRDALAKNQSRKVRIDEGHHGDADDNPSDKRNSESPAPRKETSEPKRSGASISAAGLKSPITRPTVDDDDEDVEGGFDSGAKLSKAERRRLRKLERRAART